MSANVAKLKKKAAELEQKKQFDKALAVYLEILEAIKGQEEEGDVALYNRVGDLMLRQGSVSDAVDYYERAVDLYADGGFFNNAIALCNKILRNSPGRSTIYYKLGKISAKKGFTNDAKQNFLEYADRMQKAGRMDEAFRALKEFADLCPDQDDIRLMLAEQLSRKERKTEALEQLQLLYDRLEAEGRTSEARATVERMRAIDPNFQPTKGGAQSTEKSSDLVFLDVSFEDAPARGGARPSGAAPRQTGAVPRQTGSVPRQTGSVPRQTGSVAAQKSAPAPAPRPEPPAPAAPPAEPPSIAAAEGLDFLSTQPLDIEPITDASLGAGSLGAGALSDLTPGSGFGGAANDFGITTTSGLGADSLLGLEPTTLGGEDAGAGNGALGLEDFGSSLGDANISGGQGGAGDLLGGSISLGDDLLDLPGDDGRAGGATRDADLPLIEMPDAGGDAPPDGGSLDLIMPDEPAPPARGRPSAPAPLDDALELTMGSESLLEPPSRPAAPAAPAAPASASAPAAIGSSRAPADKTSVVEALRAQVAADESNWSVRRQYAEALLDLGEREGGLQELEMAMIAAERGPDLDAAASLADEIIRLNPNSVRHHQKRVEYAFRTGDRGRLIDAYLELADSLFRSGQPDKARTVYQRVIELNPDDIRAQAALSAFVEPTPAAPAPAAPKRPSAAGTPSGTFRRYTADDRPAPAPAAAAPAKPAPRADLPPAAEGDDSFVNLGDWLRDDEAPRSTRMVVAEQEPTGDEQADFADMLRKFKQGVAQNVDEADHEAHYDLGVAYKEMGLVDEAIAEFQKALRGAESRVRTYEALGQCFLEKGQFQVAASVLQRALAEPGYGDDQLVGVLYLLGYSHEGLQQWKEALGYYQRVFAVDIEFRDVGARIGALEQVAR